MTLVAMVKGIAEFRPDSNIRGILLNRVSAMLYPRLKAMLETELVQIGHDEIKIVGYMPENEAFHLESRHLGLVTPQEMENLQEKVRQAGEILAKTVDLELLEKIAGEAAVWKAEVSKESEKIGSLKSLNYQVRIAVARDEFPYIGDFLLHGSEF